MDPNVRIQITQRRNQTNLPHDHGVLVDPLPALLGEERRGAGGAVEEHLPRRPLDLLLLLRARRPPPRVPPVPPGPRRRRRRGRRAGAAALPVRRQAGTQRKGPDHIQYALQCSQKAEPNVPDWRIRRNPHEIHTPPPLFNPTTTTSSSSLPNFFPLYTIFSTDHLQKSGLTNCIWKQQQRKKTAYAYVCMFTFKGRIRILNDRS